MPGTEKWNANTDDGLLLGFGGGFGGFFVYVWLCFFGGGEVGFCFVCFLLIWFGFYCGFFVGWFGFWFHLVCLLEVVYLAIPFLFPPCPTSSWPWTSRYHQSLICCSYGESFSEPSLWLWQDRSLWFWNSSLKTNKKRRRRSKKAVRTEYILHCFPLAGLWGRRKGLEWRVGSSGEETRAVLTSGRSEISSWSDRRVKRLGWQAAPLLGLYLHTVKTNTKSCLCSLGKKTLFTWHSAHV